MLPKSINPFYINQSPNYSSQYMFDDTYKTVLQKMKFEKNPKYLYFNAIVKMKSKLGNSQHDIYERVFSPQSKDEPRKSKPKTPFLESANKTWVSKSFYSSKDKRSEVRPEKLKAISNITQINFEPVHTRKTSQLYSQRPRLDDIMTEFRRINMAEKNPRRTVHCRSIPNKNHSQIKSIQAQALKHIKNPSFGSHK